MADATKAQFAWPTNSWVVLKKIIKAWYAAEDGGGEITQKKIADMAGAQPSQISMNKGFLQAVGILEAAGNSLTDPARRYGLGLYHGNETVARQGLQEIIQESVLLTDVLDIVRGRGPLTDKDFEAAISIRTKQGKANAGFTAGIGVFQDMLLESGQIEKSGNTLRAIKGHSMPVHSNPIATESVPTPKSDDLGLRKIPIPVNATTTWYVLISEKPEEADLDKFIEVQQLVFGRKR